MANTFQLDTGHRLLKPDEEHTLFKRIQAAQGSADPAVIADGKAAFDLVITHNLRLVYKIVSRFYTDDPITDKDDFVQEGIVGLITAANKFDPDRGIRFTTYATYWIRQAATRLQQTANTIKRPHVNKALDEHQADVQRDPRKRAVNAPMLELDAPMQGFEGLTLGDQIASESDVETEALNRVMYDALMAAPMPDVYRLVVADWLDGCTVREAGARNGVSHGVLGMAHKRIRSYYSEHLQAAGE